MDLGKVKIDNDSIAIKQSIEKIVAQRDIAVQALMQIAQGKGDKDTIWINAISLAEIALMKVSNIK